MIHHPVALLVMRSTPVDGAVLDRCKYLTYHSITLNDPKGDVYDVVLE